MNTIEQIHHSIDTAVDELILISSNFKKESLKVGSLSSSEMNSLKDLGFSNIPEFTKQKEKNHLSKMSDLINEDIKKYSTLFPFHKYILYSQLTKVCAKYNLFMSHVSNYRGDIPKKNAQEIINFPFERIISNKKNYPYYSFKNSPILGSFSSHDKTPQMLICAPKSHFISSLNVIERELVDVNKSERRSFLEIFKTKKVKKDDPIVGIPVPSSIPGDLGIIVISKWGLEANDIDLQISINN